MCEPGICILAILPPRGRGKFCPNWKTGKNLKEDFKIPSWSLNDSKKIQKTGKNFKRGWGKKFSGWPEYIPLSGLQEYFFGKGRSRYKITPSILTRTYRPGNDKNAIQDWFQPICIYIIGVFRVGQMDATHPPKVSHPFFIFAPRCRGGCKKIVFLHLFIPMTTDN